MASMIDPKSHHQSPPPAVEKPQRQGWSRQRHKNMPENELYLRLREIYLAENPYCAKCGRPANQVHHIVRGTAGKARSRLNSDTWLGACSIECHDAIEKMTWEQQTKLKQKRIKETIVRLRK